MDLNHVRISAAEILVVALKERGYLIELQEDQIVFSQGNGRHDFENVRTVLEQHGIPVCYWSNRMQLLSPIIPLEITRVILTMRVKYGRAYIPTGFHTWKAFVKRNHGVRWDSLSLDKGIAYLVKSLSEAGMLVTGGCDGHGKHAPSIYLSSEWAAAWLKVVQERFLKIDELHYDWRVTVDMNGSPRFEASMAPTTTLTWKAMAIRADVVALGDQLRQLAPMLRELRREHFKYRSMREQAEFLKHDFEALCDWMKTQLNGGVAHA